MEKSTAPKTKSKIPGAAWGVTKFVIGNTFKVGLIAGVAVVAFAVGQRTPQSIAQTISEAAEIIAV